MTVSIFRTLPRSRSDKAPEATDLLRTRKMRVSLVERATGSKALDVASRPSDGQSISILLDKKCPKTLEAALLASKGETKLSRLSEKDKESEKIFVLWALDVYAYLIDLPPEVSTADKSKADKPKTEKPKTEKLTKVASQEKTVKPKPKKKEKAILA